MSTIVLKPIFERPEDFEALEIAISQFFRDYLYLPLVRELGVPSKILANTRESDLAHLMQAIHTGQIRFNRGRFEGRFSSRLSRALRSFGAEWDRGAGRFLIPQSSLPTEIKQAVNVSEARFHQVASKVVDRLQAVMPENLAEHLDLKPILDRSIYKVEKDVRKSLRGITVSPELSAEARGRVAAEYSQTIHLPIQDFLRKETLELRSRVLERSAAGLRYETLISEIEKSYGVSRNKARFLAKQETSLLMAKFKQVRYQEAGSDEYIWGCVAGSEAHPVRHFHKLNEGKIFRWDTGAVVNERGEKKNPGQDFGCRCFPKPIVKF